MGLLRDIRKNDFPISRSSRPVRFLLSATLLAVITFFTACQSPNSNNTTTPTKDLGLKYEWTITNQTTDQEVDHKDPAGTILKYDDNDRLKYVMKFSFGRDETSPWINKAIAGLYREQFFPVSQKIVEDQKTMTIEYAFDANTPMIGESKLATYLDYIIDAGNKKENIMFGDCEGSAEMPLSYVNNQKDDNGNALNAKQLTIDNLDKIAHLLGDNEGVVTPSGIHPTYEQFKSGFGNLTDGSDGNNEIVDIGIDDVTNQYRIVTSSGSEFFYLVPTGTLGEKIMNDLMEIYKFKTDPEVSTTSTTKTSNSLNSDGETNNQTDYSWLPRRGENANERGLIIVGNEMDENYESLNPKGITARNIYEVAKTLSDNSQIQNEDGEHLNYYQWTKILTNLTDNISGRANNELCDVGIDDATNQFEFEFVNSGGMTVYIPNNRRGEQTIDKLLKIYGVSEPKPEPEVFDMEQNSDGAYELSNGMKIPKDIPKNLEKAIVKYVSDKFGFNEAS